MSIRNLFIGKVLPYPIILRVLYVCVAITSALKAYWTNINNYVIFKQSFWHLMNHQSLYREYPTEYHDFYLYGPSFAVLTGVLQYLPIVMGVLLWSLVCVGLTLHAVSLLKLPPQKETLVLLIAISEMLITLSHVQTNPILLALIIYAFVAFERKSPFWAAACILLGFHIKIFALAAGGFMLLHPRSIPKFIASSVFWFALIGALPLIFIPLEELLWQYQEWVKVLFADLDMQQEISLTGLINVTIGQYDSLNLGIQLVGMCVVCATFMQSELRNHLVLRHICLSAILIWVVIFNHAAESPTYVIALFGIGIWLAYQPQKMDRIVWILFGITLVLSLLSPMDFFPRIIREKVVEPYSLKALGPSLIWMYLIWELWVKKDKYLPRTNPA